VNQTVALMMLKKVGYSIDIAENGAEAVSAIEKRGYDLILMDIQMPVMDGFEATRRIRAIDGVRGETPIVAITANVMIGMEESYIAAGMNAVVGKPFTPKTMLDTVQRWLAPGVSSGEETVGHARAGQDEMMFDESRLAGLQLIASEAQFAELVESFLGNAAERIDRIKAMAAMGDHVGLAREAHSLISTAGNIGALKISSLARELETACADEDVRKVNSLVLRIDADSVPAWQAVRARFLPSGSAAIGRRDAA
jgi:CheY-like chemotaxis protein/HPt (histidine-containing phosphotransfer) domain-containing protein